VSTVDVGGLDAVDARPDGPALDGLGEDAAGTDGGSSPDADAGATCGQGVSREMLCTTYCQGIAAVCMGANAQYASADECRATCNGTTWACGNPGETTGNSLFCRVFHLALAGVAGVPAMECPNAGPTSPTCR
jgi:hypothetical protein